jgi:hypothetical protein
MGKQPRSKHFAEVIAELRRHIVSFPAYKSHYMRGENSKKISSFTLKFAKKCIICSVKGDPTPSGGEYMSMSSI